MKNKDISIVDANGVEYEISDVSELWESNSDDESQLLIRIREKNEKN